MTSEIWFARNKQYASTRRRRAAGTPPERPDRRHGRPSPNSPVRGRGSDTSSGAAVAPSGRCMDPQTIAAGFDRMGALRWPLTSPPTT